MRAKRAKASERSELRCTFGDTRINAFGDTRINAFGDTRINAFGDTRINAFGDTGEKGPDTRISCRWIVLDQDAKVLSGSMQDIDPRH